ncbi:MAG TPA: HAMP domain-containing sensor histidine kinase [Bryobacteraceae bacterium]|nr:HAMP domain-containing sensor histidine kinase [Bryobacteraceae bacterium]
MARQFGRRALPGVCAALVILLAAVAIVQYRWSARVAAADAQREREHLESAASLFASRFNDSIWQATEFLQNEAWKALRSGEPLASVPKLISDLYFIERPSSGALLAKRMGADGLFAPAALPQWIDFPHCATLVLERPLALVTPVMELFTLEVRRPNGISLVRTTSRPPERCFVAQIDLAYLRGAIFPQFIRESFGGTALNDYDFAIIPKGRPHEPLYGVAGRADLRKPLLSLAPKPLPFTKPLPDGGPGEGRRSVLFRMESKMLVYSGAAATADLFGAGVWELRVAHKGVPLEAAFERARRRDLLASLAVEALLAAAIVFLVSGVRRMQQAADQKMRFVAGVSHELRTPVSAIAMLARNQADGLVAGADRVRQYGELIHQQTRRLSEMVEQTLEYAGVHSGLRRPAANPVDIRALIEEAAAARRDELTRAGFEIEIAVSENIPLVSGDPKLLRTAIDNLLSNAQKHAPGGRWMRVSATYSARDKEVQISVEDRGAGIDPAEQAEIFEPFCRGRAAIEAQIPGSGLGLSLVRSAAEAHRGAVTLASEPGRGSTFTLHLPV